MYSLHVFNFYFNRDTQKELLKQLLLNPNLMNQEDRMKIISDLVQNIGNLDAYVCCSNLSHIFLKK